MQINHRDKQYGMATYTDLKLNILFKTFFLEHDDCFMGDAHSSQIGLSEWCESNEE